MSDFDKILNRKAIRDYVKKPLNKEELNYIISAINTAPTSTNSHDFSAIIINDKEIRQNLTLGLSGQKHIVDCSLFMLFCADFNRINYLGQKYNKTLYTKSLNNFLTAAGDAFIACSFAAYSAITLGLGTCYIGMVRASLKYLQQVLNLSGQMVPIIGLTIGYIKSETSVKPRLNKVYIDNYDLNKIKSEVDDYDLDMLNYHEARNPIKAHNLWNESLLHHFIDNKEKAKVIDDYIKAVWQMDF